MHTKDIPIEHLLVYLQHDMAFQGYDDDFPPPPPEALHEYHCEPVGKRCTSHEFMTPAGRGLTERPNTTNLRPSRVDIVGRMSPYPSALSSMATVSSTHEELLMAYYNSKVCFLFFSIPCN